jgi:Thioredoxin
MIETLCMPQSRLKIHSWQQPLRLRAHARKAMEGRKRLARRDAAKRRARQSRHRLRYTGAVAMPHVLSSPGRVPCRRSLLFVWVFVLGCGLAQAAQAQDAERLFDSGLTFDQFLSGAKAQREAWLRTTASANLPPALVEQFRQASAGLHILVVAEDWCPDSVNVVPYIAALASAAAIPLRIVGQMVGEPLTNRHRTPDGRTAIPTVVLLRGSDEVAAWVERPAVVQQWFLSMATSPESARRFGERESWYESDHGHTVLAEVIALAEATAAGR